MLSQKGVMKCGRGIVKALVRAFTSDCPKPYTVPEGSWGRNRAARLELAAAYRALDVLGLNEGVCNHLSVIASTADGKKEGMLVIPYGLHWSEVTASNLISLELQDGKGVAHLEGTAKPDVTASCIHLGIRKIRPDAKVIFHTHQPYATALTCMKDPTLHMVHQNSVRFYKRVAYDTNYNGLAMAVEEGKRLGEALGDKDILFMGHHGVISVATTISMAFDHLYYLERAAQLQVLTESMGREVSLIPDKDCDTTSKTFWLGMQRYADEHFYGRYRLLRKTQPEFEL